MDFGRPKGVQCHRGNVADKSASPGPPEAGRSQSSLSPSSHPPGLLLGGTCWAGPLSALGPRRSPRVKTQGARRALHAQDVGF